MINDMLEKAHCNYAAVSEKMVRNSFLIFFEKVNTTLKSVMNAELSQQRFLAPPWQQSHWVTSNNTPQLSGKFEVGFLFTVDIEKLGKASNHSKWNLDVGV